MNHTVNFRPGTHPRNHIVECTCGWKYSDTYRRIREVADDHCAEANPLAWHDPRRLTQRDVKRVARWQGASL